MNGGMNQSYLRGVYLRLAGVVTLVIMLTLAMNAALSHRTFERALAPQMAAKVASVGASLRALVLRAVDNGIAFDQLYGVTDRFTEIKDEVPEISYISITDTHGNVMHRSAPDPAGTPAHFRNEAVLGLLKTPHAVAPLVRMDGEYLVSMPIVDGDQPLGMLHLGVDVSFVDNIVLDMLYDVVVVLIVTLFFALELLHFIAGAKLEASLGSAGRAF